MRAIYLDPSVLATTSTLTSTTLANPSTTQGFLVFIRHPKLNSRDAIPSSRYRLTQHFRRQAHQTFSSPGEGHVPSGAWRLKNSYVVAITWRNHSCRQAHAIQVISVFTSIAWRIHSFARCCISTAKISDLGSPTLMAHLQ